MQVIKYLKKYGKQDLIEDFGIKTRDYPEEEITVYNYCQINSPKDHPIVMECRGLILDNEFNVVSRPLKRFFNVNECPEIEKDFDITRSIGFEKVDGSLIKIYWFEGNWFCSTRGTAFAETMSNGGIVFSDLVHDALGCKDHLDFNQLCFDKLDHTRTYIFELTAPENKVVKTYSEHPELWYLGSVDNEEGDYSFADIDFPSKKIKTYSFDSIEEAIEVSNKLEGLDEGFVLYDPESEVRIKIKSLLYLKAHKLRSNGVTDKTIAGLVVENEHEEYLSYFPEERSLFQPFLDRLKQIETDICSTFEKYRDIEEQRDFANKVKDYLYSAVLFRARSNKEDPVTIFRKQDDKYKLGLLLEYTQ